MSVRQIFLEMVIVACFAGGAYAQSSALSLQPVSVTLDNPETSPSLGPRKHFAHNQVTMDELEHVLNSPPRYEAHSETASSASVSASAESSDSSSSVSSQSVSTGAYPEKPSELFNAKITDYVIAIFTVFIAWFTWGLKSATLKLESATGNLVKEGEKTAERQLRAYVMINRVQVVDIEVGKMPRAIIYIKNFGQTPAKNFKQVATMGIDNFPPSLTPPQYNPADMVEHPIAPQGDILCLASLQVHLRELEIDELKRGVAAIFLVGEIYYTDAFGKERFTKYKLFIGGPIGINGDTMSAYSDGNEYT